jgi:hypothetical protein
MNTLKYSKISFWVLSISTVIVTLPHFCEHYFQADSDRGRLILQAEIRSYVSTDAYNIGYRIIFKTLVFDVVPIFLIIIPFNGAVLKTLKNRQENPLSSKQKAAGSTLIIVSMITVFIILKLPGAIGQILFAVHELRSKTTKFGDWFGILQQVANPLILLNSAINFLIYFSMGREFRKDFFELCCCVKKGGHRPSQNEGVRSISSRPTSFSDLESGNL